VPSKASALPNPATGSASGVMVMFTVDTLESAEPSLSL